VTDVIQNAFPAGFRLIDGSQLNEWKDEINAALDGTTPIPNLSVEGFIDQSTAAALTAAGTNRATGLALTKSINFLGTVASGTGVVLPAASTVGVGGCVIVFNGGANAAKVYAAGSDTIDGTAGSTGVTLTNALRCAYFVSAAGTFISAQLGAASA
jgi:hypothetical protein